MGVFKECYIPLFEKQFNKGKLAQLRHIEAASSRCKHPQQCKHPACKAAAAAAAADASFDSDARNPMAMAVAELKQALHARGLKVNGLKADLQTRLSLAMQPPAAATAAAAPKSNSKRTAFQTLQAEYLIPKHGKQNFTRAAVPPGYTTSNQGMEGNFRYIKEDMLNKKTHAMHNSVNMLFQAIRYHSQEQEKTRKFEFEINFRAIAGPAYFKVFLFVLF